MTLPFNLDRESMAQALYDATPARWNIPAKNDVWTVIPWADIKTEEPERAARAYREADAALAHAYKAGLGGEKTHQWSGPNTALTKTEAALIERLTALVKRFPSDQTPDDTLVDGLLTVKQVCDMREAVRNLSRERYWRQWERSAAKLPTPTVEGTTALAKAEGDGRDALLQALGFKPGALSDDRDSDIVIIDARALRPAMVEARRARDEAQELLYAAHAHAGEEIRAWVKERFGKWITYRSAWAFADRLFGSERVKSAALTPTASTTPETGRGGGTAMNEKVVHPGAAEAPVSALLGAECTEAAKTFVSANQRSLVVSGSVPPEGGATYVLRSGKAFTLSMEDCRSMPPPRWHFPKGKS